MGKHKGKTQKNRQTGGQAGRPDGKTWYDRVGESYEPGIKYGITEEAAAGETDRQPEETGQRGKNRNGQDGNVQDGTGRNQEINEEIQDFGEVLLEGGSRTDNIYLLSIIGEIEGHENLNPGSKTTKYEHVLPKLAQIEDSDEISGVLLLINTQGGDVSCGLALAEMVASLSKPTVSLVIGDSHSIGVPLAVSADDSFIVPTATMLIHPVRMSGMTIGAPQTYHYFQKIQDRITGFIAEHSRVPQDKIEEMMMNTKDLTKDLGTLLVGEDTVKIGLIHHVGGINRALKRLHEMIGERKKGSA